MAVISETIERLVAREIRSLEFGIRHAQQKLFSLQQQTEVTKQALGDEEKKLADLRAFYLDHFGTLR